MKPVLRSTIHGALGGAIGAACMTVLRLLAHKGGLIQQMVPQAVESWVQHGTTWSLPPSPSQRALHHLADQSLHVGYGATFGALYGVALSGRRVSVGNVVGFAIGTWAFGSFVLLPSLKIMRPEWRATSREVAVNLAAHFVYAATVGLVLDELEQQSLLQPLQYPASRLAKTA